MIRTFDKRAIQEAKHVLSLGPAIILYPDRYEGAETHSERHYDQVTAKLGRYVASIDGHNIWVEGIKYRLLLEVPLKDRARYYSLELPFVYDDMDLLLAAKDIQRGAGLGDLSDEEVVSLQALFCETAKRYPERIIQGVSTRYQGEWQFELGHKGVWVKSVIGGCVFGEGEWAKK